MCLDLDGNGEFQTEAATVSRRDLIRQASAGVIAGGVLLAQVPTAAQSLPSAPSTLQSQAGIPAPFMQKGVISGAVVSPIQHLRPFSASVKVPPRPPELSFEAWSATRTRWKSRHSHCCRFILFRWSYVCRRHRPAIRP